MIGNLVIFGDSYSTFKGCIPNPEAFYYFPEEAKPEEAVRSMRQEETWWQRLLDNTDANLLRNDSWSGSTICYTGYLGDCSTSSSFIYRYRCLRDSGFFNENKVDTLLVFGGTNDSWCPAELGEKKISDHTEADLYFVLPAISHLMSVMKSELCDTRVVFVANCDIDTEIIGWMKSEGERLGVEVIELHDVDKQLDHPTVLGMQQIYDQVFTFLNNN